MPLRLDLSTEKVTRYLQSIEPILHSIINRYQTEETSQDLHSMLEVTQEVLNMILFGVIQQPKI